MHAGTLGVITATEILPLYCVRDSGGTRNLLLQSRTQNAEHQTELVCLLGFVLKIQKRITFSLEKRRLFSSQPSFLLAEVFISCLCFCELLAVLCVFSLKPEECFVLTSSFINTPLFVCNHHRHSRMQRPHTAGVLAIALVALFAGPTVVSVSATACSCPFPFTLSFPLLFLTT